MPPVPGTFAWTGFSFIRCLAGHIVRTDTSLAAPSSANVCRAANPPPRSALERPKGGHQAACHQCRESTGQQDMRPVIRLAGQYGRVPAPLPDPAIPASQRGCRTRSSMMRGESILRLLTCLVLRGREPMMSSVSAQSRSPPYRGHRKQLPSTSVRGKLSATIARSGRSRWHRERSGSARVPRRSSQR